MIIVKDRDNNENWHVKHKDLVGNDHSLNLNTTNVGEDFNCWNNTAPTDSVFSLGEANGSNRSGADYIAYCFHSVPGYSAVGSYEGNGSHDGPFVYLGFRPAFLLIKLTNSNDAKEWILVDSTRDPYNPVINKLMPDENSAEDSDTVQNILDFCSNGFKIRNGYTATNTTSDNGYYVYIAFAESPFGGENAAPATAR